MPLTPDQWIKLKELIASALEMPVEDRTGFLRTVLGDDPALLDEALSLIMHSTEEEGSSTLRLVKGRYQILSQLGRGGFAIAYKALDQTLHDRPVVVKMLTGAVTDPYVYKKFEDEIRTLSLLEHPNIVIPLDCGQTENHQPFLVMQFIEGRTIRQLLNEGPIKPQTAAIIIRQLGSALGYAHKYGVIHRDIKPENVLVQTMADGSTHARLIDFGISSLSGAQNSQATAIVGSVSYMAPEQFRGEVSFKTDIFGFGALVFELLLGAPPYGTGDYLKILERQKQRHLSKAKIDVRLRPKLRQLLSQSLAYDVAARPGDILSLANDLAKRIEEGSGGNVRQRLVLVLAALTMGAVLVFGAWRFSVWPKASAAPKAPPVAATPVETGKPVPAPETALLEITLESQKAGPHLVIDEDKVLNMLQSDNFRVAVRSNRACHLYVFARSLEDASFHVLFPSPTANQASSSLNDRDEIQIPGKPRWLHFGDTPGTETLILVRSASQDPTLEQAETYANAEAKGLIPDGPVTTRLQELLAFPNALQESDGHLALVGSETICGRLTIQHR